MSSWDRNKRLLSQSGGVCEILSVGFILEGLAYFIEGPQWVSEAILPDTIAYFIEGQAYVIEGLGVTNETTFPALNSMAESSYHLRGVCQGI